MKWFVQKLNCIFLPSSGAQIANTHYDFYTYIIIIHLQFSKQCGNYDILLSLFLNENSFKSFTLVTNLAANRFHETFVEFHSGKVFFFAHSVLLLRLLRLKT